MLEGTMKGAPRSATDMIEPGMQCPDFGLSNQDGVERKRSSYAGSWLVLYVYPKDATPGCTAQSKSFTAAKSDFEAEGAVVVGLSADGVASHRAFCDQFSLTVELLADPRHELLSALGVRRSEWQGTSFWNRTTFLIDPAGVVRKVYERVKPDGHERAVLEDLRLLKAG